MVAGGFGSPDAVQVLSVDEAIPVPECLLNMRPLPDTGRINLAGGAVTPVGVPEICTGRRDDGAASSGPFVSDCFQYNFGIDAWTHVGHVPGAERGYSGFAHDANWGLLIAGGRQGDRNDYEHVTDFVQTKVIRCQAVGSAANICSNSAGRAILRRLA